MKKTLLLGCGYFGEHYKIVNTLHKDIVWTSRSNKNALLFSFTDKETWEDLPTVDETIISFPIVDQNILLHFLDLNKQKLGKLIIIGSTGQILPNVEGAVVNEKSPRDLSQARVQCEEIFLDQGGILVSSSGIYGPGKSPLDWVKKNYLGRSEKNLNVIHVHDLVQTVEQALTLGVNGTHYIASDGSPKKWNEIIDHSLEKKWLLGPVSEKQSNKLNKVVDSSWTINNLKVNLQYPDVFSGLASLH